MAHYVSDEELGEFDAPWPVPDESIIQNQPAQAMHISTIPFQPAPGMDYDWEEDKEEYPITLENDLMNAKAYLQRELVSNNVNLYDHLSDILNRIIAERPENAADIFEEYSYMLQATRYTQKYNHIQDVFVPPQFENAQSYLKLFKKGRRERNGIGEKNRNLHPNLMELVFYLEQAGVGLPKSDMLAISLALYELSRIKPIRSYRFWGKIIGIQRNYFIAETEFFTSEYEKNNQEEEELERKRIEELEKGDIVTSVMGTLMHDTKDADTSFQLYPEEQEGEAEAFPIVKKPPPLPPIPQSQFQKPREPPKEKCGEGVNKKVYFVCSRPGEEWIMLPDVTPEQIVAARQIKKFFTGNLDAELHTYPPFPGREMNYLRAQIARISATTQVSPRGFFKFEGGEEEEEIPEEEEEEGKVKPILENPYYKPFPIRELVGEKLQNWVHHSLAILNQGRTTFWSEPKEEMGEEEMEEEQEEEEEEGGEEGVAKKGGKETPPPLLRRLSQDKTKESVPPWTAIASSKIMPESAIAVLRSNLWPGAYAFASGKKFENIYLGFGYKYTSYNYSPPPVPVHLAEYALGPEIMEMDDPTVEQEEAVRLAQEKLLLKLTEVVGEVEEEEEEEEEGDDDEPDEDEDD